MLRKSLVASDAQLNQGNYYEASVRRGAPDPVLRGSETADVVVVGAGFSGLSAAIELAQRGMRVVVLRCLWAQWRPDHRGLCRWPRRIRKSAGCYGCPPCLADVAGGD